MKIEISERFDENVSRVESLIALYPADGPRRRDAVTTDILRAAVVFLHATLEELIRGILEWKLPDAPGETLNEMSLVGCAPRTRFTLPELAAHRGKTVDELVRDSIRQHLLMSNFNHPGDLQEALEAAGLPTDLLAPHRGKLGAMMSRRHWIVHRADRNESAGPGHHSTRSIGKATVQLWLRAVRALGTGVLEKV